LLFEGEFSKAADVAAEGFSKVVDGATDLNPITALMKEVAAGVAEIAVEAANAGAAAGDLEKRLNALKVAERDIALERAKANAQIEQQKLIAEDITKTIEERITATQKASDIETGLLAKEIALAQERVDIIAAQNALSASSEEDIQKLYDA